MTADHAQNSGHNPDTLPPYLWGQEKNNQSVDQESSPSLIQQLASFANPNRNGNPETTYRGHVSPGQPTVNQMGGPMDKGTWSSQHLSQAVPYATGGLVHQQPNTPHPNLQASPTPHDYRRGPMNWGGLMNDVRCIVDTTAPGQSRPMASGFTDVPSSQPQLPQAIPAPPIQHRPGGLSNARSQPQRPQVVSAPPNQHLAGGFPNVPSQPEHPRESSNPGPDGEWWVTLPSIRFATSKDPLTRTPEFDYQLSTPGAPNINCTVVELVVFIPKLYRNNMMATRFVNNGMTPKVHREMLRHHRAYNKSIGEDFNRSNLLNTYRSAMRGPGATAGRKSVVDWQKRREDAIRRNLPFSEPKPIEKPEWSWDFDTQNAPEGWDHTNISINHFVPDRIHRAKYPEAPRRSVPFTLLADNVAKFPQGPDAADLTRAIKYAMANPRAKNNRVWVFPDDWQEILRIIGRTKITEAHLDGPCIMRYEDAEELIEAEERPTETRSTQARFTKERSNKQGPEVEIASTISLIRKSKPPRHNDISENAQIVKYARNHRHEDWLWIDGHVGQITAILTHSWIDQLNERLDESSQPRWQWVPSGVAPSHIWNFMNDGMQRFIHWRVCDQHARVLAHVDLSSPQMDLKALAEIVLNFSVYQNGGSDQTPLQHIRDWELMTREVMRQLQSNPELVLKLGLGEKDLSALLAPIEEFNVQN